MKRESTGDTDQKVRIASEGDKLPMPPILEPFAVTARNRVERRPASPGVVYEDDTGRAFGSPHADMESWRDQILDAFGTRSRSAAEVFLGQLANLFRREWNEESPERSELELNAVLAFINGIRPRSELEACLAAQMAAVHILTMRLASRALVAHDPDTASAALAGKCARTFALQAAALAQLKGRRSRQHIRVERHAHHHQHMHVVPGEQISGNQPHAPTKARPVRTGTAQSADLKAAVEHATCPAVLGKHAKR